MNKPEMTKTEVLQFIGEKSYLSDQAGIPSMYVSDVTELLMIIDASRDSRQFNLTDLDDYEISNLTSLLIALRETPFASGDWLGQILDCKLRIVTHPPNFSVEQNKEILKRNPETCTCKPESTGWTEFALCNICGGKVSESGEVLRSREYETRRDKEYVLAQICPRCNGEGRVIANPGCTTALYKQCEVCKGAQIIPMLRLKDGE